MKLYIFLKSLKSGDINVITQNALDSALVLQTKQYFYQKFSTQFDKVSLVKQLIREGGWSTNI